MSTLLLATLLLAATNPSGQPASLYLDRWLVVDVDVGGRVAPFVVDTGANHTLIDAAFAKERGIEAKDCIDVPGAMVGKLCRGKLPTVKLAGRSFDGIDAYISDMTTSDLGEALGVAGLIGDDVLSRGVLVVDYPASRWRFVSRDEFHPDDRLRRVDATFDGGIVRVIAKMNGTAVKLLLDSGNAGDTIALNVPHSDAFLSEASRRLALPGGLKSGAGGGADIAPGRATLAIGPFTWSDAPLQVALAGTTNGAVMSREDGIVGAGFLRHFRMAVDVAGGGLWLEQIVPFGALDATGSFGLIVRPRGGKLVIDSVAAGGPAAKAGLLKNDVVVRINDVDVAQNAAVLWPLLMAPPAARSVHLDVERGAEHHTVALVAVNRP